MRIRRLPEGIANRIAAGEVIERPSSIVKELAENAIDAGASRIDIVFRDGGRGLIRVSDDGHGMTGEELPLAVERHATSKLDDDDLVRISTLGFRGEALPSIGAVSRLRVTSRAGASGEAWALAVEAGRKGPLIPAALARGTVVEVTDLFFAVPARLKFLRSPRAETAEAAEVVRRLALATPEITWSFTSEERNLIDFPADPDPESRMRRVLGREAAENLLAISAKREGTSLSGCASLPSYNRGQANHAYFFVNDRPVRDKLLLGAVKAAYADVLMKGRHPVAALFLECPPEFVDVNVHPAKAEVRFRDPGLVRSLIVGTLKSALTEGGRRTATGLARSAEAAFHPEVLRPNPQAVSQSFAGFAPSGFAEGPEPFATEAAPNDHPLGAARAQFHENYILSQTGDGVVIVDQHAAHERLVYERMKAELANGGITGQPLLIPEVVELDPASAGRLAAAAETLARLSLIIEPFGETALLVREIPAVLSAAPIASLVKDIADDLAELDASAGIEEAINRILATAACHHSVRSGRWLKPAEMDALLREMERTPNSGHCNHGRPTYVALKLSDIEKLFGRR
ncbi:MAG: DNA mismatch repair endonuclease MutL [Hyphomicrobiales bacterium]